MRTYRGEIALIREDVAVSSDQPLANPPETIDAYQDFDRYPLMSEHRDDASIAALVVYLFRVLWWRWKTRKIKR